MLKPRQGGHSLHAYASASTTCLRMTRTCQAWRSTPWPKIRQQRWARRSDSWTGPACRKHRNVSSARKPLRSTRSSVASEQYHPVFTTLITHVDSSARHACMHGAQTHSGQDGGCEVLRQSQSDDEHQRLRRHAPSVFAVVDKVGRKSRRCKIGQARQAHTPYDAAQK